MAFNHEYEEHVAKACVQLNTKGVRELHYGDGELSSEFPWAIEGLSDIYVWEICEQIESSWLMTLICPADLEELAKAEASEEVSNFGYGYFALDFDVEIVLEFATIPQLSPVAALETAPTPEVPKDSASLSLAQRPSRAVVIDLATGETKLGLPLESEKVLSIIAQIRENSLRETDCEVETYRLPVWSQSLIEERLGDWLETISGKRFELSLTQEYPPMFAGGN